MNKKLPDFKTDEQVEDFLDNNDMSNYLSKDNLFHKNFEFLPKDKKIGMRFSSELIDSIKTIAEQQGLSYQKYIRMAVEQAVRRDLKNNSASEHR